MRLSLPVAALILLLGCRNDRGAAVATPRDAVTDPRPAPCAWPDSLDAVRAAPANHRVVLENDAVRVLDVTVQPGEREPLHAHCWSSVMYLMAAGRYRDYDAGGAILADAKAAPDSLFPLTLWRGPEAPHAVENLDARPLRLLRVELKK
jgi:hypothetical protein